MDGMADQLSVCYGGIDQIPEGCLDYVIVLIQIPGGFSLAYDLEGFTPSN